VADRLQRAAAEGRLLTEELEHRLEIALSARTYGQLDALVADLPGPPMVVRRDRRALAWVPPVLALAVAIPLVLAVVAAIVLAVTGVVAMWWVWLVVGWFVLGRHRRPFAGGCGGRSFCSSHRSRARRVERHASRPFWA
jgi:hypothetical protein